MGLGEGFDLEYPPVNTLLQFMGNLITTSNNKIFTGQEIEIALLEPEMMSLGRCISK